MHLLRNSDILIEFRLISSTNVICIMSLNWHDEFQISHDLYSENEGDSFDFEVAVALTMAPHTIPYHAVNVHAHQIRITRNYAVMWTEAFGQTKVTGFYCTPNVTFVRAYVSKSKQCK